MNILAVNGSPRKEKGHTANLLNSFIQGMEEAGGAVDLIYTERLEIKACRCDVMNCWYKNPGECCFQDDMRQIYPRLKQADILVLATPIYIPLPGSMQNFVNRLCPLIEPLLEFHQNRTRARFREDVSIKKMVLVSTGGWWEKSNFEIVTQIVKELAQKSNTTFAGAVIRPHAFVMKEEGKFTEDGLRVLEASREAGYQLVSEGAIHQETLDAVSRPLISEEELREQYNQMV